jgi:hypothetical protein
MYVRMSKSKILQGRLINLGGRSPSNYQWGFSSILDHFLLILTKTTMIVVKISVYVSWKFSYLFRLRFSHSASQQSNFYCHVHITFQCSKYKVLILSGTSRSACFGWPTKLYPLNLSYIFFSLLAWDPLHSSF